MLDQHRLELERTDPVVRGLEHVICTPDVGDVTTRVPGGHVACVIRIVAHRLVGLLVVAVIADHQPHWAPTRAGEAKAELTLRAVTDLLLTGRRVEQDYVITGQGPPHRSGDNLLAGGVAHLSCCLGLAEPVPDHDAKSVLDLLDDLGVERFSCAPPTVYRMLIQQDLAPWRSRLSVREMVGAGEPLNPEVIEQVQNALGVVIRDGFGQTETTAQVGNTPSQEVVPGSMGRPLPGYDVVLLDPATGEEQVGDGAEGELCLRLSGTGGRPVGLMVGYHGDYEKTDESMRDNAYHTGDVASRDARGYITYVGRADDVFKASDYRISPFELESVLIEHPAVAEAAIVPSPDPTRLAVPKAYVVLAPGYAPTAETAESILAYAREHLAAYKRIRRIEFAELPKTISGKIRRVELRGREETAHGAGAGADASSRASTPVSSRSRLIPLTRMAFPPALIALPMTSPARPRSRRRALMLSVTW